MTVWLKPTLRISPNEQVTNRLWVWDCSYLWWCHECENEGNYGKSIIMIWQCDCNYLWKEFGDAMSVRIKLIIKQLWICFECEIVVTFDRSRVMSWVWEWRKLWLKFYDDMTVCLKLPMTPLRISPKRTPHVPTPGPENNIMY